VIFQCRQLPAEQLGDLAVLEDRVFGLVFVEPDRIASAREQVEPELLRGGRLAGSRKPVDED